MTSYFDSIESGTLGRRDLLGVDLDNTYPGMDLTLKFADEIKAAPYNGDEWAWIKARINIDNFSGIHVRDYIPVTANGRTYKARIMGINTYHGYGDTEIGPHIDWTFEEVWTVRRGFNLVAYNNGLIPVENVSTDGTSTEYTLTKEMNSVSSITLGGETLSGWTYDAETYKLTFGEAPAAGTMVVTGSGTEFPWLACDAYHYVNSLAGQVPNGTELNPAVKHVDYTQDGVYYYLPQKLKNVIIQKRMRIGKRYSKSGILSESNGTGWVDIGYLWFPTEYEIFGCRMYSGIYDIFSSAQYPYFAGNMNRIKRRFGVRNNWLLLAPVSNSTTHWCGVDVCGYANLFGFTGNGSVLPVCFRT